MSNSLFQIQDQITIVLFKLWISFGRVSTLLSSALHQTWLTFSGTNQYEYLYNICMWLTDSDSNNSYLVPEESM